MSEDEISTPWVTIILVGIVITASVAIAYLLATK